MHDVGSPINNAIRGAQTHALQERRASARRGSVNRTLYRENRTLSSGCPNTQARAAGVSPPWVLETHLQERCRKVAVDCHRCAHERWCSRGRKPTGGLRPPQRGGPQFFSVRGRKPTGGTPPALVLRCERLPAKNGFFDAQTRNPKERLASARRGVYWIALATATHSRWRYIG
jgi:hypothetical protein